MAEISDSMGLNSLSFDSTSTVNSRAPLTSSSSVDQDTSLFEIHAYESPLELQKELQRERAKIKNDGHRKKQCLLYEPTTISNGKLSDDGSDGVRYVHAHDKLYRLIFILLFLLVLMSLSLSVMTLFGIRIRETDCRCIKEVADSIPRASKSYSTKSKESVITDEVQKNVMQIQRNFTYLYSVVIPQLHATIERLRKKAELKVEISKLVGPQGPQGPAGPTGPSGAGNLSQCTHHSSEVSSQISTRSEDSPRRAVATTKRVYLSDDKVITGMACSSTGAAEYNLIHRKSSLGKDSFYCRCAGKATSFEFITSDNKIYCTIHWWECPLIS